MQTFVPYPDAAKSAAVLDQRRLGKQRVETLQLLLWLHAVKIEDWESRTLTPRISGWNHPAMKMWAGSERALLRYQDAFCDEWTSRGYKDTCKEKSHHVVELINSDSESEAWPSWWGNAEIHRSHRSNLVWKDPVFYSSVFPNEVPIKNTDQKSSYLEYIWPSGRLPYAERIQNHYLKAVEILSL
jgi:hypothetical protein